MDLFEGWNTITEELKRTFFSDREAFQDRHKNFSQITKEIDVESTHVNFDPFGLYQSNFALGGSNTLPVNTGDMIRRWRDAAMLPEVDEALTEITSEAIVFDELEEAISLNLDEIELTENIKSKIRESFDHIMYLLDFNEKGEELFRQWYIDSTLNFECVYNNRKMKDGIQKLILLPPFDIQKYKNVQDSTIRWFINKHQTYNPIKDLENAEITYFDEQITQINSGVLSPDKKAYYSPIQKAMKAINQLYLLEDTLIIYRITRSTEKRMFNVDVGNLPKSKAEEYMKGLINKYRQKKVYNTETGSVENASKSISILEDLWFPKRSDGRGTTVDTLQGSSTNFGGFDDIDYFVNKVYTSLNIPTNRRSKENRITINPTIDIEKDEMKFFKYIQKLRRRFNNLFVDLLKKDLIAKQILSFDDWKDIQEKIKFTYASSNEISMIKKSQINDIKVNSANNALGLIEGRVISTTWIQKNLLMLSDEEIAEVNEQLQQQGGADGQPDALGNAPMAGGGGEEVPGYTEVGGAAQPNMQPTPDQAGADGGAEQTDTAPKPSGRFQQKARESNLSQDVIDNLKEGSILSDGGEMLIFENGMLKRL